MNLVEHARRELELCGQTAEDPAYAQSIIAAVAAFGSYDGHSGFSMACAIHQLTTLLQYKTLSLLTNDPDEWMEVGTGTWQSMRRADAFSRDGGKTHYLLDEPEKGTITSAPALPKDPSTTIEQARQALAEAYRRG